MANSASDAATGFRIMMVERVMEQNASLASSVSQLGQSLGAEVSEQLGGSQSFGTGIDKPREL